MEKIDGRKVSQETLGYLRNRCVALRKQGKQNSEIARLLGLAPQTTSRWWRIYRQEGKKALEPKKVGRPKGSKKALTPEQEKHVISLLVDKNPKELKFKFALWTRESVKALIDREFEMDMPISTVGHYLKEWQFTAKKPIKRAYERNDAKAKAGSRRSIPKSRNRPKRRRRPFGGPMRPAAFHCRTTSKATPPKAKSLFWRIRPKSFASI